MTVDPPRCQEVLPRSGEEESSLRRNPDKWGVHSHETRARNNGRADGSGVQNHQSGSFNLLVWPRFDWRGPPTHYEAQNATGWFRRHFTLSAKALKAYAAALSWARAADIKSSGGGGGGGGAPGTLAHARTLAHWCILRGTFPTPSCLDSLGVLVCFLFCFTIQEQHGQNGAS